MDIDDIQDLDLDSEATQARQKLEHVLPARIRAIVYTLAEDRFGYEHWHTALTTDLALAIGKNCEELLGTTGTERLSAAAWSTRNLLELRVWVKYCGNSRENAWRFHEDALRDVRGLSIASHKLGTLLGIRSDAKASMDTINREAQTHLGLDEIDDRYETVGMAANAPTIALGDWFASINRMLSKFAHPTAGLIHGIIHQKENTRKFQNVFICMGTYLALESTFELLQKHGLTNVP